MRPHPTRRTLSRRGFLEEGGLAAAGLALGLGARTARADDARTVRCCFVGVGNRGTTLLEATVDVPGVQVACICDLDAEHRRRASGIVEEAGGEKPDRHFGGMHEQLVGPKGAIELLDGYVAFRKGGSPEERSSRKLAPDEVGDRTELALAGFFDCVRTGKKPFVGVEDGRAATLFGLLVRQAVYEERTVTMEEILSGGA